MRPLLIFLLSSFNLITAAQDSILTYKVVKPKVMEQQTIPAKQQGLIFQVVEQMPEYPGGDEAMMKFIMRNFNTGNLSDSDVLLNTKFVAAFIVSEDGSVSDIKVKRPVSPSYDAEAIRVIKSFPRFKPGMQQGKAVKVAYVIPIILELRDDSSNSGKVYDPKKRERF